MFYQIFLSPQVKQWAVISYQHGIHELPHELLNKNRSNFIQSEKESQYISAVATIVPISSSAIRTTYLIQMNNRT